MNKRKILIIGNSFFPENSPRAFRTTELVKEFAHQGHDVTVLVPKNDSEHPEFEQKFGVSIIDLGEKKFREIDIKRGNKYFIFIKRVIKRTLYYFFHYPNIEWMFKVKKALKKQNGFDLLITIAVPHPIHWGTALTLNNENNIANTWVADCGDPFMGSTTDSFSPPFYFKFIEKYWNRKCNYISIPFEGAIDGYYKKYHNKFKIIPQGFNFKEININTKEYSPNKVPTFAFTGQLIPGVRDPKPLIDYLLSLNIDLKFIFYTQSVNMLSEYIGEYNDLIELREYIPRNELLIILSKMDFLVNFDNGISTQLPSKLIDYYLTGRPILSIDSNNFDKNIIFQFIKGNYTNQYIIKNPNQYRIKNVCRQFLDLIK